MFSEQRVFELPVKDTTRTENVKTVAVLLATFNGLRWLPEQVDSILKQIDVNVLLYISDDLSIDGTWEWIQQLAALDCRVSVLPQDGKFGRAGANFYRLLLDANLDGCDFVAFSDQDDIWELDKLSRHVDILSRGNFDGVSSDVTAFWEDGRSARIFKAQAQREFDYLFESAGPGCTCLFTPWLVGEMRRLLLEPASYAKQVDLHDWLAYAICRAAGRAWYIDSVPTVKYRQHFSNEFGANQGFLAKVSRFKRIKNGWYRAEVIKILRSCLAVSPKSELVYLLSLISVRSLYGDARLLLYTSKFRRRLRDRVLLGALIVLFIF